MIVPANRQAVCNALMEALKRGPNTFSAAIRDKATLARVAYAAHTYDDDLADALAADPQVLPDGVVLADLQAHGFTGATARTAVGHIRFKMVGDRHARANFSARLDQEGWEFERSNCPDRFGEYRWNMRYEAHLMLDRMMNSFARQACRRAPLRLATCRLLLCVQGRFSLLNQPLDLIRH